MSAYGCDKLIELKWVKGETAAQVRCGSYLFGELIQCEACQEDRPALSSVDPEDADARAELEAERNFKGRRDR